MLEGRENCSNLECLSRGSNRTAASHMVMKHSRIVDMLSSDGSMKAILENAKISCKSLQIAAHP